MYTPASLLPHSESLMYTCHSIQNQYITHKVVKYKSIISRDIILQTPMNTVDFVKFENEQSNYIYERQQAIAKSIQDNLPLGKVLIKN